MVCHSLVFAAPLSPENADTTGGRWILQSLEKAIGWPADFETSGLKSASPLKNSGLGVCG